MAALISKPRSKKTKPSAAPVGVPSDAVRVSRDALALLAAVLRAGGHTILSIDRDARGAALTVAIIPDKKRIETASGAVRIFGLPADLVDVGEAIRVPISLERLAKTLKACNDDAFLRTSGSGARLTSGALEATLFGTAPLGADGPIAFLTTQLDAVLASSDTIQLADASSFVTALHAARPHVGEDHTRAALHGLYVRRDAAVVEATDGHTGARIAYDYPKLDGHPTRDVRYASLRDDGPNGARGDTPVIPATLVDVLLGIYAAPAEWTLPGAALLLGCNGAPSSPTWIARVTAPSGLGFEIRMHADVARNFPQTNHVFPTRIAASGAPYVKVDALRLRAALGQLVAASDDARFVYLALDPDEGLVIRDGPRATSVRLQPTTEANLRSSHGETFLDRALLLRGLDTLTGPEILIGWEDEYAPICVSCDPERAALVMPVRIPEAL